MTERILPGNYAGGAVIMESVAGQRNYSLSCYVKVCTKDQLRALIGTLEELLKQVEEDEQEKK